MAKQDSDEELSPDFLFVIDAGKNPKGPRHSTHSFLSAHVYISKIKVIKYVEKEKVN